MNRIHVFGASGSGTTTLGAALARELDCPHLDTDDYYWKPTDPPFQEARPVEERVRRLRRDLPPSGSWVLSGSMDSWAEPFVPLFDLVVFLDVPTEVRLQRLRRREKGIHGDRIRPGGDMHEAHEAFIAWASHYDDGSREGRSRPRHEAWVSRLPCPLLRIEGDISVAESRRRVLSALQAEREAARRNPDRRCPRCGSHRVDSRSTTVTGRRETEFLCRACDGFWWR